MIPRQVLFGNPDKAGTRISPDGRYLSYLAPEEGVLNVWVAKLDDHRSAKPITKEKERGIWDYYWTHDGRHILYIQDAKGDENWHLYAANIATGETRDLTPLEKVSSRVLSVSENRPDEILARMSHKLPE